MAPGSASPSRHRAAATCGTPDVSAFVGVNTKRVQDFQVSNVQSGRLSRHRLPVRTDEQRQHRRKVRGRDSVRHSTSPRFPNSRACPDNDCHLRARAGVLHLRRWTGGWVAVSKIRRASDFGAAECAPNTACLDCAAMPSGQDLARSAATTSAGAGRSLTRRQQYRSAIS